MGKCQPRFFTSREEAVAGMFVTAGIRRCPARVLVCLITRPGLTSRDIERGTGLRQPEVSIAMNDLLGRRWVEVLEPGYLEKGQGRPVRRYRLTCPVNTILQDLEEEKRGKLSAHLDILCRIRTVMNEPVQV